jgi:hypothetical protein
LLEERAARSIPQARRVDTPKAGTAEGSAIAGRR